MRTAGSSLPTRIRYDKARVPPGRCPNLLRLEQFEYSTGLRAVNILEAFKSLPKPFLISNQGLSAAGSCGLDGEPSTGIHFFPEKTTTSTPATTARPGMATIWTSW